MAQSEKNPTSKTEVAKNLIDNTSCLYLAKICTSENIGGLAFKKRKFRFTKKGKKLIYQTILRDHTCIVCKPSEGFIELIYVFLKARMLALVINMI